MKKLLLAPAVAVVAGSIAFAGSTAYAAPVTGEPKDSAEQSTNSDITVEGKDTFTVAELDKGVSYKIKGLKPGQKVTTYLRTSVSANAQGDATADKNGNATVNLKPTCVDGVSAEECWAYPDLTLMVLVDGKAVDHKGVKEVKVSDAAISAKLNKDKVTVEELANKKTAPVYSGTGLEPNKKYRADLYPKNDKDAPSSLAEITFKTDDKGNFSVPLATSAEVAKKAVGEVAVSVYSVEHGMRVLPVANFTVTEAPKEDAPGDPDDEVAKYGLKVSPKEVTPGDFVKKDKGVQLTVTGLKPNEKFRYSVSKKDGGKVEGLFKEVQANKDGVWSYTVYGQESSNGLSGFLGSYNVTVKSEEGVLTDTFKVTNTPGKNDDPKPEKPKPEAPKPEKPKPEAPKPEKPKPEEEAPNPNNPNPGEGGKPEKEAAKYGLKVSPKEVTPGDFVKKDKGVKLVVTGLKPNEKFNYSVSKKDGGKVKTLFKEVQANKDGVWSFTVYGQEGSNGLSGFLGTYNVTVKSEEGVLTDSFKVTNTPGKKDEAKPGDKGDGKGDAKGGDNNSGNGDAKNTGNDSGKSNNAKGNGTSSNTLPRTGMELSGLIAGGALLTVGAATVLVTRRRTK